VIKGVVLAVNARVLVKNLKPFDTIFHDLPHVQLLVWTGTGEPPISFNKISTIRRYFEESGHDHLVGFDCKVSVFAELIFLNFMALDKKKSCYLYMLTH